MNTRASLEPDLHEVQLVDVFVDSISLHNFQNDAPIPEGADVTWHLQPRVEYRQTGPDELRIKVAGQLVFDKSSVKPFDLKVVLVGVYRAVGLFEPSTLEDVVQTHSIPLLWPYLRELVSDLTMRAGGPTLFVPTLLVGYGKPGQMRRQAASSESDDPLALGSLNSGPPARKRRSRKSAKKSVEVGGIEAEKK